MALIWLSMCLAEEEDSDASDEDFESESQEDEQPKPHCSEDSPEERRYDKGERQYTKKQLCQTLKRYAFGRERIT